jgi:hypothetical protein
MIVVLDTWSVKLSHVLKGKQQASVSNDEWGRVEYSLHDDQ